jgi:hypothetical protein
MWEMSSRRRFTTPAQSLSDTIVARTKGYTYDAKVWALYLVEGPFSVAPCQTTLVRIAPKSYSDEKVANREIRVWHFVIENGY